MPYNSAGQRPKQVGGLGFMCRRIGARNRKAVTAVSQTLWLIIVPDKKLKGFHSEFVLHQLPNQTLDVIDGSSLGVAGSAGIGISGLR